MLPDHGGQNLGDGVSDEGASGRLGHLHAQRAEQIPRDRQVEGLGIHQDSIHVEDHRAGHTDVLRDRRVHLIVRPVAPPVPY